MKASRHHLGEMTAAVLCMHHYNQCVCVCACVLDCMCVRDLEFKLRGGVAGLDGSVISLVSSLPALVTDPPS